MGSTREIKVLLAFLLIFLCAQLAIGAGVGGRTYDDKLNPLPNVLVEVTTYPKQSFVAKNGSYEFTLTSGRYMITAYHKGVNGTIMYTTQEVLVSGGGDYIVDLILDKVFTGEPPYEDPALHIRILQAVRDNYQFIIVGIAAAIGITLIIVLVFRKREKKEVKSEPELEKGLDFVITIIRKSGGRLTQKELRKEIPNLSEAKISLMVTELEAKGYVEKIKRGRGNVIVFRRRVRE